MKTFKDIKAEILSADCNAYRIQAVLDALNLDASRNLCRFCFDDCGNIQLETWSGYRTDTSHGQVKVYLTIHSDDTVFVDAIIDERKGQTVYWHRHMESYPLSAFESPDWPGVNGPAASWLWYIKHPMQVVDNKNGIGYSYKWNDSCDWHESFDLPL